MAKKKDKKPARVALSLWKEIDPKEALTVKALKKYEAYKASYKQTSALRVDFEAQVQEDALATIPDPKTQEIMFSYKFAKLSMAIGPKLPPKGDASSRTALVALGGLAGTIAEAQALREAEKLAAALAA